MAIHQQTEEEQKAAFEAAGLTSEQQQGVITGADLSSTYAPLNLPETPQDPNYQAVISSIPQFDFSAYDKAVQTQDDFSKQLLAIAESFGGRESKQLSAEQTAGLPAQRQQLQDVMGQLQTLQKESAAIPIRLQEEAAGRGITEGGLAPIQAGELRKNAIRALGLSAIGQTLQGNIALAQQQVDRAIDIEFGQEEAKLNYLKTAYEMNKDVLNREDKKRAEALQIQLAERERILNDKKEDMRMKFGVIQQAAQGGADNVTLEKMRLARSKEEALAIGGFYLGSEFREKVRQQQIQEETQKVSFNLSVEKFNEDKRQFNLDYALRAQKAEIDRLADEAKLNPEGANVLKESALTSATELLRKFDAREGTGAVGKSRIFGFQFTSGTQPANFKIQFDNLKSLLSLDNVSLLKGQGTITENERKLLADASARLSLSQSEPEFRKALLDIQSVLGVKLGINPFQEVLNPTNNQFINTEEGYILPNSQSTPIR